MGSSWTPPDSALSWCVDQSSAAFGVCWRRRPERRRERRVIREETARIGRTAQGALPSDRPAAPRPTTIAAINTSQLHGSGSRFWRWPRSISRLRRRRRIAQFRTECGHSGGVAVTSWMNSFGRPSSAAFIQVSSKVATAPFLIAIDADWRLCSRRAGRCSSSGRSWGMCRRRLLSGAPEGVCHWGWPGGACARLRATRVLLLGHGTS
jgi:hypothetical protein